MRAVVLLAAIFAPHVVLAQGSPGPMSSGHADLTSFPVDCNKCHEAGFGVPDDKCLACHTHQPLRARIKAGLGFHASDEVKGKACKSCHAEHKEEPPGSGKGKKTIVDWRPFGGQRNFNHRLTGWPLEGAHRFQKCEKCHDDKYPKTQNVTYLGDRGECSTCHFGTKEKRGPGSHNPHRFTDVTLTDCQVCHNFTSFKVANLGATKFDHDKTAYPLVGNHQRNKCVECHQKDIESFKIKDDFKDCKGCHEDSHRSVISAKRDCKSCHSPKVEFRKTSFDHGKETRFALRGQHAKNRCKDCHKLDSKPEKPDMRCVSCHDDVHKGRFGKETCEGCHVDLDFKQIVYDHNKKTKFALTGKHQESRCVDCHRFGIALEFEKFKTTVCADCHKHQQAHCGQFGMENCERCHVQGGDRTSKFDHNLTRFPLQKAHGEVDCARCHRPEKLGDSAQCKESIKYTGLDPQCAACHEDIHQGELGKECSKCHTGGENFKTLVFDHNKDAQFGLTGFHQLVGCEECHVGRKYKLGKIDCYSCHKKDDVHVTALGEDCAKCHEPSGGAPKFDHNLHTEFDRRGVHAQIECARCHFLNKKGDSDFGPLPGQPATTATKSVVLAATAPPGAKLDLVFRAAGKNCENCHPDPHGVRPGLDCSGCHAENHWHSPPRNQYHESAGFSLTGAHTVVACSLCHTGAGSQQGRGERCGSCHIQDDVHAGSFGADCGRCHEQKVWLPTTFTHTDVAFVLQGVHRMLDCRQCHQAGNYFIPSNCWSCHLTDYRGSQWHQLDVNDNRNNRNRFVITGGTGSPTSLDCDRCHNQFSFNVGAYSAPLP